MRSRSRRKIIDGDYPRSSTISVLILMLMPHLWHSTGTVLVMTIGAFVALPQAGQHTTDSHGGGSSLRAPSDRERMNSLSSVSNMNARMMIVRNRQSMVIL